MTPTPPLRALALWCLAFSACLDEAAVVCPPGDGEGRWDALASDGAPGARYRHALAWVEPVHRAIIWGGSGDEGVLGNGFVYDAIEDTWRTMAGESAPSPRTEFAWAIAGSKLLVFGGRTDHGPTAPGATAVLGDGAIYDVATDRWTTLPSEGAPSPRYRASAAASLDGRRVFVAAGLTPDGPLADLYQLALDVNPPQWSKLEGTLPLRLSTDGRPFMGEALSLFAIPGGLVVFSGLGDGGASVRAASWQLPAGPWLLDDPRHAPPARAGASAVRTSAFGVMIYGGHDPQREPGEDKNGYFDELATFSPPPLGDNGWQLAEGVKDESVPRAFHGAVWTGDGLVVAGGLDPGHCGGGALWEESSRQWKRLSFAASPALGRMPGLLWAPRLSRTSDGVELPGLVVFGSHRPASLSALAPPAARWSP